MSQEPVTYAFIDLETTGLDPEQHEIWEIGLIIDRLDATGHSRAAETMREQTWYLDPLKLGSADAKALEIGRFYERHPQYRNVTGPDHHVSGAASTARHLAMLLRGVHLVGCTVHFDAAFLARFLRTNGQVPMWDYHLLDATVYAAGRLGLRPPWKSKTVADAYGLGLRDEDAHCALNDAEMARRLFYAALDLGPA